MTHNARVLALLSDGDALAELLALRPMLFAADRDERRFLSKVREAPDGCWEWTGSKCHAGYGRLHLDGSPEMPHRVMFRWFYGTDKAVHA